MEQGAELRRETGEGRTETGERKRENGNGELVNGGCGVKITCFLKRRITL